MSSRGGSVVVVAPEAAGTDGSDPRELLPALLARGWSAHLLHTAADPEARANARRRRRPWPARRRSDLDGALEALDPDLVHCLSLGCGLAAVPAASAIGSKLIMSVDGDELVLALRRPPDYHRRVWEEVDVVQLPEPGLWPLAQRAGCPGEKARGVIPPTAAPSLLESPPAGADAGARNGALRILSVGALRWDSGYEYALEAVRFLLDRGVASEYRIVGDGDYAAALAFARDQLALGAATEVVPGAEDLETLRAHMDWADVYLSAGLTDGDGKLLVGAQAMALPVVATAGPGGARELVPERTGFVVPRRDPDALTAKLELLSERSLRRCMGEAARAVARDRFGIESHVTLLDELYRRA